MVELYVEVDVGVDVSLPLLDVQGENGRRRTRFTQYASSRFEASGMECYESIIDLLDFEDVFEYFDETEGLADQSVLDGVGLSTNMLKGLLVIRNSVELKVD